MDQKRSYAVDCLKLAFIYLIITFHTRLLDGIVNHGYIGVEFFFIASGFYLQRQVSQSSLGTLGYLKRRVQKLYPRYVFSLLLMTLIVLAIGAFQGSVWDYLAEIFLLQGLFPVSGGGVNFPCWYLSVLIWDSAILYFFLRHTGRKTSTVVLLLLPVLYYGYSFLCEDGRAEIWNSFHFLYLPVFRGFAGLSLGILTYRLHLLLDARKMYAGIRLLRAVEVLCSAGIVFLIICPLPLDCLTSLVFGCLLLAAYHPNSLFERIGCLSFMKKWASLEYALFLDHALIVVLYKQYVFPRAELHGVILLIAVCVTSTLFSMIASKAFCTLKSRWSPVSIQQ